MAGPDETAADLGFRAADSLLHETGFDRSQIDALLFCTQSPDYFLPTTACLLQTRLGLSTHCTALDYNLGCSGFVYGVWLARSLILSDSAQNVLLIAGDTLSKYCDRHDATTATIFGDGAAAALITRDPANAVATLGRSILGTDGRGGEHLIVRSGAARRPLAGDGSQAQPADRGSNPSDERLFMNGPEIFAFTLSAVQPGIQRLLDALELDWNDIDLFFFHQANRFMLEQLRRQMSIPLEKMPIRLEMCGNTASASIPIILRQCEVEGMLKPGHRCVMAGFGVGFSWAMGFLQWI